MGLSLECRTDGCEESIKFADVHTDCLPNGWVYSVFKLRTLTPTLSH